MPEDRKREGRGLSKRAGGSSQKPRRPDARFHKFRKARYNIVNRMKPGLDPRLKKVLACIGVPETGTFKADPFQLKALATVRHSDCLVSAPTGSGKTWIAEEAIERILKKGGRAWYASPLKALTNSKYLEFSDLFGAANVGILTGDRKENADAPVTTGTTEILRNQLYDAMHGGLDLASDLVILDEAHFLGDPDRGVVWEEIMIYLPVRVHLLLLSATIGNASQIAEWLESIRSKKCVVIEETARPVPLYHLFFHPSGTLLPFLSGKGMDKKVRAYLNRPNPPVLSGPRSLPPFGDIIRVLRKFDLLPAIFFLKSRADCDGALERCRSDERRRVRPKTKLNHRIDELTHDSPRLAGHRQIEALRQAAVGAHHGGQLPAWKLVVERLMTEGLLDAVFATSTVAAGVNFPARSVLFFNSDRYNGHEFVPMNATEFHQMTGRAGRRGKDYIGFSVAVPGKFMDLRLISELCSTPPEDIVSQIKVDFSMVLNLLLSHTPEEVKETFEKSFAAFLNLSTQAPGLKQKLTDAGDALMILLPEALCNGPESVLALKRRRAACIAELATTKRHWKKLQTVFSKAAHLVPGRLFLDRRNRMYCAVVRQERRGQAGVLALRVKPGDSSPSRRTKLRWFPPEKVSHLLDRVIEPPPWKDATNRTAQSVKLPLSESPAILNAMPTAGQGAEHLRPLKSRILILEKELDGLICHKCSHRKTCHGKYRGPFGTLLEDFAYLWDTANKVRMGLWNSFMKHFDFLKEEGFVGPDDRLTDDGVWASQLRLDEPLMIAEGLRRGVLPAKNPALLAALVAPFVYDRETDTIVDESKMPGDLVKAHQKMQKALGPLVERKTARGFEARVALLCPAATIYAWAAGQPWEKVLEISGMAEGDLAMLVSRTADNLRQIGSLGRVYPDIARNALKAISIIIREPVLV